jgi:hypothetical protein
MPVLLRGPIAAAAGEGAAGPQKAANPALSPAKSWRFRLMNCIILAR